MADRRGLESPGDDCAELLGCARDPTAAPAEREGGAHDAGQADVRQRVEGLAQSELDVDLARARMPAATAPRRLSIRRDRTRGHAQTGVAHRGGEQLAILGTVDRVVVGADQLDPEALQRAVVVQRLGEIQRGLSAERRQQRVGVLALDDLRDGAGQQRLDVGGVGELGVGHDRRRVGVDEHDLVALFAQDLAGLHAGVVELGGLPDHDRSGPEDQDLVDVIAPGHLGGGLRDPLQEAVEQVHRVVRAGPGLGVVLHGAAGHVEQLESLDSTVIEIDVR